MILSKSNYLLYLKHPAWLWLEKHNKEKLPLIDADTQSIFDDANVFEKYAEAIFPNGILLGYKTDGEFDWNKYKNLPYITKKAIIDNKEVLFQGRFEVNDITCVFDCIKRNKDGTYNLYEIKSSARVKKEHKYDLAFQTVVLEESGLNIKNIFVIYANNEYVRDGDIDTKQITKISDVTLSVRNITNETIVNIEKAKEAMISKDMPDPSPRYANFGAFNEWIEIYKILNPNLDKYSIYNLYSPGAKSIGDFEDKNISLIKDIPDDAKLSKKQQFQVMATKSGEILFNKKEIKNFLNTFKFPLYFLDYETFSGVLPAFDGLRPYQQSPFQYSLHILESYDGRLLQKEYLHTKNTLPFDNLLKQLKEDIGKEGSIVVWNQNFEKSCNITMFEIIPEYFEFLSSVNNRIVDLMIPFFECWYVDKDFFGSASIKAVLPVFVPELSYDRLNIKGGVTAQRVWMETILNGKNKENKEKIMNDLRKYCALDTLAMVEIYKKLVKFIEIN